MNQILITKKNFVKKKKFFFYIFIISILIIAFSFLFKLSLYINQLKYNKYSKDLKSTYNLEKIYINDSNNYTSIKLSSDIDIIGVIKIPKINLEYPIISNSSDKLLKISVCKFSGPNPNNIGNLAIVRA